MSINYPGATFNAADVHIMTGTDVSVRNDPKDPSGFSDHSKVAVQGILEMVRDTYIQEVNRAPVMLREQALREIAVYNHVDRSDTGAMILAGPQDLIFDSQTRRPVAIPLSEPKGMGIGLDESLSISDKIISKVAHECRHLLTRSGIHMFNAGPNESLIAALDKEYDPKGRQAYLPIDTRREHVSSTTGLNTPTDFGSIDYSNKSQEALYLAAHSAFQDIEVESIWKIWTVLTELALREKRYPLQHEIRATLSAVLQERADAVIANPALQPMSAGFHVAAFQTPPHQPGNSVHFRAFAAQKNAAFGLRQTADGGLMYNDLALTTLDTYTPLSVLTFNDHAGNQIPGAEGRGQFKNGSYHTSFAIEAGHVTKQLKQEGQKFLQGVDSIVMNTQGLPLITLKR